MSPDRELVAYGEREAVLNTEEQRYAKALRHPLRARILNALQEREATPTELAAQLDASVGTVAYHVRTLNGLGLIELTGETRVRGAVAHHYRAVAERADESDMGGGAVWAAVDPSDFAAAAIGSFETAEALAKRASLRLDAAGWQELSQACARLLEEADQIARSSARRLAKTPHASARAAEVVLLMSEAKGDSAHGTEPAVS